MSVREVVRQLRAVENGGPIPRFSTRHIQICENPMFVAFVRMAGESRPWGIAYGRRGAGEPTLLTAGDGRNREAVAEIMEQFGKDLLLYCRAEGSTFDPLIKENIGSSVLPQIWVPGPRHVEMFHHIEYAYWRVRKGDDRTQPLTVLARLAGWLFRESGRAGQQQVIDASKAISDAYVFPSDTVSLGNLTTSLGWFVASGTLQEKRLQVRSAGQQRVSPTLDPTLDSKVLGPLIERRAELQTAGTSLGEVEQQIHDALAPELRVRWQAVADAYEILAADPRPENPGVRKLVEETMKNFVWQFQRIERQMLDPNLGPAYTRHPETDFHGSAAASNYFQMAAADNAFTAALIHDDAELQRESLASGHAFRGEVVEALNRGTGQSRIPIWRLKVPSGDLLRLREGERYSLLGNKTSVFLVRSVDVEAGGLLAIEGEWLTPKKKVLEGPIQAAATDPLWEGESAVFVPCDGSQLDMQKSQQVWKAKDGIGAWLTHGRAPDNRVDNIVDDITQLEGGSL